MRLVQFLKFVRQYARLFGVERLEHRRVVRFRIDERGGGCSYAVQDVPNEDQHYDPAHLGSAEGQDDRDVGD